MVAACSYQTLIPPGQARWGRKRPPKSVTVNLFPDGLPSRVRRGMLAAMKGIPDDLRAVLDRIRDGSYSDGDFAAFQDALRDGRLVAATGDRAVAAGGHIEGAAIVTGDGNVLVNLSPDRAEPLLDRLFPPQLFQLPPDLPDFVGRKPQIDRVLETMWSGGEAAISAFAGLGGIGKTSLAVHVAHRLKDDYPDGQIVVEMRGTHDKPLKPAEAMARVIHAFQPEARLPDNLKELSPIYHHVLHGRRVLVLLDNARDAAQVRPLRVTPPCGLMITSRGTIALEGLEPINLEKMSVAEANELLKETAGRGRTSGAQRKTIGELCGRLPLALRVAGTFLRVHRGWSVGEYIDALSDERTRLGRLKQDDLDVEAVLGLSARQFVREDPELAARWQMLSVFPSDFDRAAAAAIWDLSDAEARDDLERLAERSLLDYSKKATPKQAARYQFHDLMRPVARQAFSYADASDPEADQKRLSEAEARHASHYCNVLALARGLYEEGNESIQRGLALYETESKNIHAGQAWAAGHASDDDRAVALCDEYPDAGVYILNLRLHPPEWIAWLQAALAAARRLARRQTEAFHLGNLGLAYSDMGEPRRAIKFHMQALEIAREIGDRREVGATMGNLGTAYASLGEPRRAIEFYEQALQTDREIGDRRGEGNALGNLGNVYSDLGEPRHAIELYEQHLEIAREIGDRRGEGSALGNLGNAYNNLSEPHRAIKLHEERLQIAREIGDRRGEGNSLGSLGNAYGKLGDARRAIELYEQAIQIDREIGDRNGEECHLGNLGNAYADLGDARRAIGFYEQAIQIARKISDRRGEGNSLYNMGLAHDELGERNKAMERAEAALGIYEAIEDPNAEMVRKTLAEWREEGGDG